MGQTFLVVRCFNCQTFQVQQEIKAKKWKCKVCGSKQSFLKIYASGTAADCRGHVQKLNMMRGEKEAAVNLEWPDKYPASDYDVVQKSQPLSNTDLITAPSSANTWNQFITEDQKEENNSYEDEISEGIEVTTDPQAFYNAQRKKLKSTNKQPYHNKRSKIVDNDSDKAENSELTSIATASKSIKVQDRFPRVPSRRNDNSRQGHDNTANTRWDMFTS